MPKANNERMVMDFEKAAAIVLFTTFPAAQVTGCYFQIHHSVLCKITEVGLKKSSYSDPESSFSFDINISLAILPLKQVEYVSIWQ